LPIGKHASQLMVRCRPRPRYGDSWKLPFAVRERSLATSPPTRAFTSLRAVSGGGAAAMGFDIEAGLWGSMGAWRGLSAGFEP
jgi:hypothetical protein